MVKEEKKQLRAKPWPDLPQPICGMISRESSLLSKIHSKGQTKSWVMKSSNCKTSNFSSTSWLQSPVELDNGSVDKEADSFSIRVESRGKDWMWKLPNRWYPKEKPRCHLHCLGWSKGFLVAKDSSMSIYDWRVRWLYDIWYTSSYDPRYWRRMNLSSWGYDCSGVFLSSDFLGNLYENGCIALVVTGTTSPAFGFCRLTYGRWRMSKDWTSEGYGNIVDPHCSNPYEREHFMRFTNAIGFRGKFYAVSLRGTLVVIEDKDGVVGITGMCKQRVVPSVSSKHYRECLVESEGRVLLVFLISRNSLQIVDGVEVYEINEGDLKLSKCENLGDTAVFLGANCCMAISGRRVGCKGNSIYFTHCSLDDWWGYDLKTNTISPTAWNHSSLLD